MASGSHRRGTRVVCHHRRFAGHCGSCRDDGRHCTALGHGEAVGCVHRNWQSCCESCTEIDGDKVRIVAATPLPGPRPGSSPVQGLVCHHCQWAAHCGSQSCREDGQTCVGLRGGQYIACHHNSFRGCCENCRKLDGVYCCVLDHHPAAAGLVLVCHHERFQAHCGRCEDDGWHCLALWPGERVVCQHRGMADCCAGCNEVDGAVCVVAADDGSCPTVCRHRSFQSYCGKCEDDGRHCLRVWPGEHVGCVHTGWGSVCAQCQKVDGEAVRVCIDPARAPMRAAREGYRRSGQQRQRRPGEVWPPPGVTYQVWTGDEWQHRPPPVPHAADRALAAQSGKLVRISNLSNEPPPEPPGSEPPPPPPPPRAVTSPPRSRSGGGRYHLVSV